MVGAKIKNSAISQGVLFPPWFSVAWFFHYDVIIAVYRAPVNVGHVSRGVGHVLKGVGTALILQA